MKSPLVKVQSFKDRLFYEHKHTLQSIREHKDLIEKAYTNGITIHELTVYNETLKELQRRKAWESDLMEQFETEIQPFLTKDKNLFIPTEGFED